VIRPRTICGRCRSKGGAARRLVDGSAVEPKGAALTEAEKSRRERQRIGGDHGVVEYKWDEAGRQILIPAGGQLYITDANSGEVKKLGDTGGAAIDAKISAKGRYVTYVRDQNLQAIDVRSGRQIALTTEGKDTLSFGVAEFVAQEEMERYTGYWTSPDDRLIAFTRVDESPVDVVPRFDIGAEGAIVLDQRYPRAGRPNAVVDLYVAPLDDSGRCAGESGSGYEQRCVSGARGLGARRQDAVRAARKPRPDHAGSSGRRSGDRRVPRDHHGTQLALDQS
jgi:dipeptidyl-peptidase-4